MLESSVSHFFDCSCKFGGGCNGFEQWRELRSSWLPALLHPPSRPPHSNDQHLSCRHLSRLDLRLAKGEIQSPRGRTRISAYSNNEDWNTKKLTSKASAPNPKDSLSLIICQVGSG